MLKQKIQTYKRINKTYNDKQKANNKSIISKKQSIDKKK